MDTLNNLRASHVLATVSNRVAVDEDVPITISSDQLKELELHLKGLHKGKGLGIVLGEVVIDKSYTKAKLLQVTMTHPTTRRCTCSFRTSAHTVPKACMHNILCPGFKALPGILDKSGAAGVRTVRNCRPNHSPPSSAPLRAHIIYM